MLLDDIIALLSDESGSLNNALLKTKVLLHTIGKKDLAAWVTHELQGYPDKDSVPDYRIVRTEVHGHVASFGWEQTNTALPIKRLEKDEQKSLTSISCRTSISSLEEAIQTYRKKGGGLQVPLSPEYAQRLKKGLRAGVEVLSAWREVNMIQIEGITTQVRSRLLDFALELRGVVGADASEPELIKKTANVDTDKIFGMAIYGTGHIINIGNESVQIVNNEKNDIEGLINAIGQLGFQQPLLADLREAIAQDDAGGTPPDVTEGKTGEWFRKALKEAGKGVLKAGVDVVSSVIVKAIKAYTGLP